MALYDPLPSWFLALSAEDQQRRKNLQILADGLYSLPKDYNNFDMAEYYSHENPTTNQLPECGTVACAVGHGPAFGIPVDEYTVTGSVAWELYNDKFTDPQNEKDDWKFAFLFGSNWQEIDNTPKGAAKRIYAMLALTACEDPPEYMVYDPPYLNQVPVNYLGQPT